MKLFGTDGIRGEVGLEPINKDSLRKIGFSLAETLFKEKNGLFLISNDGRESYENIQQYLYEGIKHQGCDAVSIGLMTTPGLSISLNKQNEKLISGIQITASHNLYQDNGMKFFNSLGMKLNDNLEKEIEKIFNSIGNIRGPFKSISSLESTIMLGHNKSLENFHMLYINELRKIINKKKLKNKHNYKILLDCANGATSEIVNKVFLDDKTNTDGFFILPIWDKPNGKNINKDCGAAYPENLSKEICRHQKFNISNSSLLVDFGVALDGDGDRAIFVLPDGSILDGDEILFILTKHKKDFQSYNRAVVGTIMTNYGIKNDFENNNIEFHETMVGDKHVIKKMIEVAAEIGGESSGHIILSNDDNFLVGDGLITLINIVSALDDQNSTLTDLKKMMNKTPSRLINLKVTDKLKFVNDAKNIEIIKNMKNMIRDNGAILVRESGTENLIRLFIQHENTEEIERLLNYFYDNINKKHLI